MTRVLALVAFLLTMIATMVLVTSWFISAGEINLVSCVKVLPTTIVGSIVSVICLIWAMEEKPK